MKFLNKLKGSKAFGAGNVGSAFNDFANSYIEYKKFVESEETSRNESNNYAKVQIAEIHARRDVLLRALENDHQINKEKIRQSFQVIDNALQTGNIQALELGLGAMVRIAETSSIANLTSLMKQLENKNNVIDV